MLKRLILVLLPSILLLVVSCDTVTYIPVDIIAPGVVTGVSAVAGDGEVTLNWENPGDSDLYSIEISYTGEGNPITITDGAESKTIEGLNNGVTYTFYLVATDHIGNRSESVSITSKPLADVVDPDPETPEGPATVENLIAEVGDKEVTLRWENPSDSDFSKVTIEYTGLNTPIEVTNGNEYYVISGLNNGESYTFILKTYDLSGNSSGYKSVIAKPELTVVENPEYVDGINTVTGYAENYVVTGDEMVRDFTTVTWNEIYCDSVSDIDSALSSASPGDKIIIAPGTYNDKFKLSRGGSQNSPVWIVAEDLNNQPIMDGGDYNNGTTLAIDGGDSDISYIYIEGITVINGRTGITTDRADYVTIDSVEVYNIGQEAIHVRDGSQYNIVKNSYIHDTGLYNVKYGEGVYIGSDNGKWYKYDAACDYTQVLNNTIGPNVTAEHIDIKEGSSYAYIIGNVFDAAGMIDILNGGRSFIDFKGNNAVCAYNTGDQNGNQYFENAFEVNDRWEGWGNYNYIHNNTVTFNSEYYNSSKVNVTIEDLALGADGIPNFVTSTGGIDRDHWVVEWNDQSSYSGAPIGTTVFNNTRIVAADDKMYNSSSNINQLDSALTHEEVISLGL